jgi:nucleoside-diphosphate-sugar epimerase
MGRAYKTRARSVVSLRFAFVFDTLSVFATDFYAHARPSSQPRTHSTTSLDYNMHVFVTGATGWVGSAIVPELLQNGHTVLGLARSEESARKLSGQGAEALMGTLEDMDVLKEGASRCDAVIHAGFIHNFADYAGSAAKDAVAIAAMGEVLKGTSKPFVVTSGSLARGDDKKIPLQETDEAGPYFPRLATEKATLALADAGVKAMVLRLAPSVHGSGDQGFVYRLVEMAKEKGFSAYVGEGGNAWPAVHRKDAAVLYRLAIEKPAGRILHGFDDQAVAFKEIAQAIGQRVGVKVKSVPANEAEAHFGWLSFFVSMESGATSQWTKDQFGWTPKEIGLLEDIRSNY